MNYIHITPGKKGKHTITSAGKHVFFVENYSGDVTIEIESPDAQVYIYGLYVGKGDDIFTLKTIQHHKVGNSFSDLLVRGVFYDQSKFIYEGLIRIDEHAQNSNAYQKNENLILSGEVFVESRPNLEILANDVRCTHGSTTGRISPDSLWYLATRGLKTKRAEDCIVEGFLEEVRSKVTSDRQ